jgi:hypothetical protein
MAQSRVRKWTICVVMQGSEEEEGESWGVWWTAAPPDEQPISRSRKTLKAMRRYLGMVVEVEIP